MVRADQGFSTPEILRRRFSARRFCAGCFADNPGTGAPAECGSAFAAASLDESIVGFTLTVTALVGPGADAVDDGVRVGTAVTAALLGATAFTGGVFGATGVTAAFGATGVTAALDATVAGLAETGIAAAAFDPTLPTDVRGATGVTFTGSGATALGATGFTATASRETLAIAATGAGFTAAMGDATVSTAAVGDSISIISAASAR